MRGLLASSVDHQFIAVDGVGNVRTNSFFSDKIDFQVKGLPDLIFDPHQLEEAFWAGEPDEDVDVAFFPGFASCI